MRPSESLTANHTSQPEPSISILIQPQHESLKESLGELWRFRELLYYLTWRDIKIRYKQTILGVAWAVLQPLIQMVIFSFIFGQVANLDSEGYPYPIFTFTALVPWIFFSSGLSKATLSLTGGAGMLKKIYFPRLIMPLSAILSGVIDMLLSLVMLFILMAAYGVPFTPRILLLPVFLLQAFITAFGVSLWLAPLNVQFRDVRYAAPFLISIWQWVTPVAYSTTLLSDTWRTIYSLNPMAGVIEGFRWALLGKETQLTEMVIASVVLSLLVLVSGFMYFRRMESTFADVV